MASVEFKRGPLKNHSFSVIRDGGAVAFVHGRNSSEKYVSVKHWVDLDVDRSYFGITYGKGDPDEHDWEEYPDQNVLIHPSRVRFIRHKEKGLTAYMLDRPDYISPNRMIHGDFSLNDEEFAIQKTSTETTQIAIGVPIFEINYRSKTRKKSGKGNKNDFLSSQQGMRELFSEYLGFLRCLEFDPEFKDVEVIVGGTHPRMARLAVNRLGFSPLVGEMIKSDPSNPDDSKRIVAIAALKKDLISQRSRVYDLYVKLGMDYVFKSSTTTDTTYC
jgi:hypothetical protein